MIETTQQAITQHSAEQFIYREAKALDEWKLEEWASLFTEDGEYLIPPLDKPDAEPGKALFLVYDDRHRLGERAKRLLKQQAHAEFPRSRVRHLISNVVVEEEKGLNGCARLTCNFVVYRTRHGATEQFPGHMVFDVVERNGSLAIRRKLVVIDTDTLRDQGRVSIIL